MQVTHKWEPSERLRRLAERHQITISPERHVLYRDTRLMRDAWRDVVYTYDIPALIGNAIARAMIDSVSHPSLDRSTNGAMTADAFGQLSIGEFWEGLRRNRWIIRNFGERSRAYLLGLTNVQSPH